MATTNNDRQREAIFNRLDEIFCGTTTTATSSFETGEAQAASGADLATAKDISANTSDKAYRRLMARSNVTSYSKIELLHQCPRAYKLENYAANTVHVTDVFDDEEGGEKNLDFAFGHAVGSGIQTYGATRSLQAAQLAAFLAWKAPYDAEKLDKRGYATGKSLVWALHAVEKFAFFMETEMAEWEVLVLPNGKPAVELAFGIDTQNGYFHFGHIDTVLRHRETNRLAVWEGKTTGFESVKDAMYANSYQALGYSVVVDAIASLLGLPGQDYEVLYVVYSSKARQFQLLQFAKNRTQRAEWLQDLLLTHAMIGQYESLEFYPKRGSNCINKYGSQCKWFGSCSMRDSSLFPGVTVEKLTGLHELKTLDFSFTLEELIAAQKERG